MARLARLYVPGLPQLVAQRGNGKQPIFIEDADRKAFLGWLRDAAREHGVAVHAYVLMPDHFHLLGTPTHERSISRMLQSVGRRYVAYFNQRVGRTGTLWEGRYRSTVLDPDRYLLPVMRHVELNPVRAALTTDPTHYPWSSCAHHVGINSEPWLTDHPAYWGLANTPFDRQAAYRHLLEEAPSPGEIEAIRAAARKGWILGDEAFAARIEGSVSRRPLAAARGRPRKSAS